MAPVAKHVHAATQARPDRVYKTGVIYPYPLEARPDAIARQTIRSFVGSARTVGPTVSTGMQPEEVAAQAQRVASAISAGTRLPASTDQRLIRAAHMILQGRPFVIKSAGRAATVRAQIAPASWEALNVRNPARYGKF